MNILDIDSEVKQITKQFEALVNLFDVKSNLEKDKIYNLSDVMKSREEAKKIIAEYSLVNNDFLVKITDEAIENNWQSSESAEKIFSIYSAKLNAKISENINLLLAKHIHNAKSMVLGSKSAKVLRLLKYSHNTITDAAQRKISLVEKFRKDIRKVLIDFCNDMKLFGAYNNGKTWAYTLNELGETYKRFLISDYIKTDLKDKIFHPNVRSLAYVED